MFTRWLAVLLLDRHERALDTFVPGEATDADGDESNRKTRIVRSYGHVMSFLLLKKKNVLSLSELRKLEETSCAVRKRGLFETQCKQARAAIFKTETKDFPN